DPRLARPRALAPYVPPVAAAQLDAIGPRLHARIHAAAHARVEDDAGREAVALADEARQRRPRDERAGDQQVGFAGAVAVAGGDGDGHDAERGEVVRQLRPCNGIAVPVGDDRAEEERGGLEARAQDAGEVAAAAAAGLALALLALRHLRRDGGEVAGEAHAQP